MMHRCSSDCPCGTYNQGNDSSGGFPMFSFSMPNNNNDHPQYYYKPDYYYEETAAYDNYDQNTYSSVDCTLSLGTPSTRLGNANERPPAGESRRKPGRGASGSDPLAARRCANCDTTSTPLWRNGPRGPKSLCNACGIRFKKEERRAAEAAAAAAEAANNGGAESMQNSWPGAHHTQMPYNNYASPAAYGADLGYMDEEDRDSSAFLSWRLNVHYCS